jgi:hypothetical protein
VINISLPPSFFTQLDDDVLSDNIIENINNQNLSWVAGRNFPENEAKEFLAKELSNIIIFYYYYYYLVCWLTGCTPKQKPTVHSVIQCNSSKSDCVPVTGNAQLNL